MKRVGGFRRKSRHKMRKSISEKGKLHISRFLGTFELEDRVLLKAYPSYQKGLFCLRFHGNRRNSRKIRQMLQSSGKRWRQKKRMHCSPVHLIKV